jgi:hypothetical protein
MTCARAERKRLGRGEYSPECVANRARAEKELTEPVVNAMPVVIAPADATPEQLAFVEWLNKYRAERA